MKKWFADHPYISTSVVFLIIIILGWKVLYWQKDDFTFLLLLYFIVTLGIRLDDISRKIGRGAHSSSPASGENETLINQLNDIKGSLSALNATLDNLLEEKKKENR